MDDKAHWSLSVIPGVTPSRLASRCYCARQTCLKFPSVSSVRPLLSTMRSWKSARMKSMHWVQAEVQKPAATPQHALWRSLVLKSRISSTKSICHNPKPRNHVTLPFGNGATRFQAEEAAFQQAGFDSSHHQPRFDRAGAVIEYAPDHSTEQMQLFVHQRQLHLKG